MYKVLILGALVLAGCAGQQNREHPAMRDHALEIARCDAENPKIVGHMVARAICMNAVDRQYRTATTRTNLMLATRMRLAEQVDHKEISVNESTLRMARADFESAQQERQTGAAEDTTRATNAAGSAAILRAIQQPKPYYPTPYVMPTTPQNPAVTCIPLGGGAIRCQ